MSEPQDPREPHLSYEGVDEMLAAKQEVVMIYWPNTGLLAQVGGINEDNQEHP